MALVQTPTRGGQFRKRSPKVKTGCKTCKYVKRHLHNQFKAYGHDNVHTDSVQSSSHQVR